MKVDKQKFVDAINYIQAVNNCELADLDLSEFFDKDTKEFEIEQTSCAKDITKTVVRKLDYDEILDEWSYVGLNNKDFIATYGMD
jgi:hypothetical protein